jgi:hypothetical protein
LLIFLQLIRLGGNLAVSVVSILIDNNIFYHGIREMKECDLNFSSRLNEQELINRFRKLMLKSPNRDVIVGKLTTKSE